MFCSFAIIDWLIEWWISDVWHGVYSCEFHSQLPTHVGLQLKNIQPRLDLQSQIRPNLAPAEIESSATLIANNYNRQSMVKYIKSVGWW